MEKTTKKMIKQVRFAVVGCGHIGKRHAEMIAREEGAELVALEYIRNFLDSVFIVPPIDRKSTV